MYHAMQGSWLDTQVNDFFENWTVQVRKGLLELFVLNALADKECYAYQLVKTLVELPGLGVGESTLYPLLSRLRVQGIISARLVESNEGPARKYYALTPKGRKIVASMNTYISSLSQSARTLQTKETPHEHESVDHSG